ncbi:MAG: DUF1189 family protein [Bacillota bacterium]
MFRRVKESIIAPERLIKYRNDRLYKVFLYMFFFAILMTTSVIITLITFDGVTAQQRRAIEQEYTPPESACVIEDAVLECDSEESYTVYTESGMRFVVDGRDTLDPSDYSGLTYHFVLHEESAYVFVMGMVAQERPISELDSTVHTLDFNPSEEEEEAFFDSVFTVVNEELDDAKPLWGSAFIITELLSALILFNLFVLLNAFLIQRRLKKVPFKQMYKMMTYASTLLFVVLIFDSMWEMNLFLFLVLLFIAFRQTSKLSFEIQRRLYKQ